MGCFYSEPSPNVNTLGGKWKAGEEGNNIE